MRIGVIGGGVAGIVASYLLSKKGYEINLFEANSKLGGHTNSVTTPSGVKVDTGFIVLNDRNYPHFHKFLDELGVKTRYSDMSFSCSSDNFEWGTRSWNSTFATRRNIFSPKFFSFLLGIKKFWDKAGSSLDETITLREWCDQNGISKDVQDNFLIPFAGAIWSAPKESVEEFPVCSMFRFFKNHGMLSYTDQPRWQTVVGGSEEYVKRFLEVFKGRVHLNSPVTKIRRDGKSINVYVEGHQYSFDKVVIACHADLVLNLLESPTEEEIRHFSPWKYQLNRTFLHKDTSLMPKRKAAWSSWNYIIRDQAVFVTYDMRRLQGLEEDFFVTLNPPYTPNEVLKEIDYHHPIYSKDSVQSQRTLHTLQGRLGTYYCGSYFGYGFHEDAVRSAVTVSEVLN